MTIDDPNDTLYLDDGDVDDDDDLDHDDWEYAESTYDIADILVAMPADKAPGSGQAKTIWSRVTAEKHRAYRKKFSEPFEVDD